MLELVKDWLQQDSEGPAAGPEYAMSHVPNRGSFRLALLLSNCPTAVHPLSLFFIRASGPSTWNLHTILGQMLIDQERPR